MQLNAERIKKQMQEWCDNMCENTCLKGQQLNGKTFTCEICFPNTVRNALSLITSQEQRIKELTEEVESLKQSMEHEHASFMETFGEYGEKCERLTEEVASWKAIAEGYQKQFEDCAEDRAKLTEENESWQKSLITQKENADKAYYELACEVEDLRSENERLRDFNSAKCEDCAGCTSWKCDCANIEADTVRNIQDRVQALLTDEEDVIISEGEVFIPISAVRKIAKEMLEGG